MKHFFLTLSLLLLAALPLAAAIPQWKTPLYSIDAREMDIRQVLDTFGIAQGIPVVFSEEVQTIPISGSFKDVPATEFLNKMATISNLTWYFDGTALYIYGAGEVTSTLEELKYVKADEICAMLKELGVEDERFPIKAASDGQLLLISGPPRYVSIVIETLAKADALREQSNFNEIEMRVFPLQHTWADDVDFNVTGAEGALKIQGIATLLKDMMGTPADAGARDLTGKEEKNDSKESIDSYDEQKDIRSTNKFTPVIKPENRLNAVIVRDASIRMPLYERIIQELDKPQKVVEITVTLLELNRDDALDWQLSLKATGIHSKKFQASAGQNAGALFTDEDMAGSGLAGALSYLGHDFQLAASLTALKQKHNARSISRTMLLTFNNMSAELSDMKTFHARIAGKEVTSFEEVTAGTKLQVRPRVVSSTLPDNPWLVWLTMQLQDGGFEAVTVDDMPMSSTSTLTTQAAVYNGDSLLLAGYMRDIDEDMHWGIPLLRDIPYIGWLFGGISTKKTQVQRMFILTPQVIDLTQESLAIQQATRQRDLILPEQIVHALQESDAEREIREAQLEAEQRHREEDNKDQLKQVKFEIRKEDETRAIERRKLQDNLDREKIEWKKEIESERQKYKEEKRALEKGADDAK